MALRAETTTGAVVVPSGGMASDILLRLDLRPVSDPVFHELLGPVVVAEPSGEDPERVTRSRSWCGRSWTRSLRHRPVDDR
ncbi:MAG: hypothetical protein U0610_04380 [bacterium]